MPGFINGIAWCDNVNFDTTTKPAAGIVTADGELLIGAAVAPHLRAATLTAGPGVSITNAAGAITIGSSGGGLAWSTQSASTALIVNNGFIAISPGGALSFSLPATSAVGDMVAVTLDDATSWTITQAANQRIRFGNIQTTLGAGGSISSSQAGDTIMLVCRTANLIWQVISSIGNFSYV